MSDRVLITGATGYLGAHVAKALHRAGYALQLLRRSPSSRPELEALTPRWVQGDLLDGTSLDAALEGCRYVVHGAGLVKNWERDRSHFDRVNVEALDALLGRCARAGVERVVYTSSFFALGPSGPHALNSEDKPRPTRWFNDYDRTKIAAVEVVARHRAAGLDVVACLPTVIYGPGARTQGNLVAAILEDLLRGKLPGKMGDGSQLWNYAHVADVAEGHLLALQNGGANEDYLLGGENVSLGAFLDLACDLAERPRLARQVPFWLLDLLGRLQMLRARLFGIAPELTPGMVAAYREDWACDDSKARRELGYAGRALEPGLRETITWLQQEMQRR